MDILDSRDLITLREELRDTLLQQYNEHNTPVDSYDDMDMEWFSDTNDTLLHIKEIDALEDELNSEWKFGVALINEDYFTDYCEELCRDCGYISDNFPGWIEIDWKNTANNIRVDYNEVEYRGETYLCRL